MSPTVDNKGSVEAADKEAEFEVGEGLNPSTSIEQASLAELADSRNGQFHRSFSPRQIHVSVTTLEEQSSMPCHKGIDLILVFLDHLPWIQHWQWRLPRHRQSVGKWWSRLHDYCLLLGLLLHLGCVADARRDDHCLPDQWQLHRLCGSLGRPCAGFWCWLR